MRKYPDTIMKSKCQGCKDYKLKKQLPDYQVTFNNWCELFQTPSALIRKCDFHPGKLESLPKTKIETKLDEFFNIFAKKRPSPPPFLQKI
ncbi:MAG: hypothetical protein HWN66_01470 [Candidatus Helarchaeota archaeon]|nr:hypothetical protein [Candidatus Helarchaeota archaeon]